jgi:hypothetical protein
MPDAWANTYWPVWLTTVLVTFLAPEVYALMRNTNDTFSDWVWRVLYISTNEGVAHWNFADLITFCTYMTIFVVWLPFHFWFRLFR